MPVHAFVSEPSLPERGLTNYWGYNTLGFFAPHAAYAAGDDPVGEFRAMVWALHDAGIEVLLDVVYNHTAEGCERGPTLSMRGLDNQGYYRLEPTDLRRYVDVTGVGNTLDTSSPHVVKMICDSLRYWVEQMGVDGFRFDLATALARDPEAFNPTAPLLTTLHADPLLSRVKLIAEPWDLGWGGYQVGAFPAPWTEWNGRFRDTIRDVWNGRATGVADLGYRITGSSDLYNHDGRRPWASANFVTAHDGFPLADVVSYDDKHNEANGEGNRDGETYNRSANHGVEGPTTDAGVLAERRRVRRALLATLLLSTGVPMLLAGDEFGRSQGGNNNAYCQDNEISWLAWPDGDSPGVPDPVGSDPYLVDLVVGLLRLRREACGLVRTSFFHGGGSTRERLADLTWFRADGAVMSAADWHAPQVGTLAAYLAGDELDPARPGDVPSPDRPHAADHEHDHDSHGQTHDLLLVLHPATGTTEFRLPGPPWGEVYHLLLDTAAADLAGFPATLDSPSQSYPANGTIVTKGRCVLVLRASRMSQTP
jgi:glycogen operon protein